MKTHKKSQDKILIVTLGCSKNTVDSEKLMRQLTAHSIKVEYDSENSDARTVIVNTCGFINDAKQESVDTIVEFIQAKEEGLIDNLYVMGCLSERYADALRNELPEVDKFFGVNDTKEIIATLGYNYKEELVGQRNITTPSHYAYLKISEGCDRKCSFCAIPLIRGAYKSISVEDLVNEAEDLATKGVKELILIAQDISYYGVDLYNTSKLAFLVEKLAKINGIDWIRLHYAYPAGFPTDLIQVIRDNPKVCKYLDIPFQHISDNMLKSMRRGLNKQKTLDLIHSLRANIPGITLRTTLMVGYPGETDKDFEELLEFIDSYKFERLGVFTYSEEESTYAAKQHKDNIPSKLKLRRADLLMELQQKISSSINEKKIGNVYKTLIDRLEGDYYIGRTEYDSPEIDNEVLIKSNENLKIGHFYNIKITNSDDFDLIGIVIK